MSASLSTALVIGGGIGGWASAAALAPHCDRVLVIERDDLSPQPGRRRGVPQGDHFHVLAAGGRIALEELLPGTSDDLRAKGVPWTDPAQDTAFAWGSGWLPRGPSTMHTLQPSRHLLEWYLRERVSSLPNVEIVPGTRVMGLHLQRGRVAGVDAVVENTGEPVRFAAGLVVDSSGRASQSPSWLTRARFDAPGETVVDAHWGFASTHVTVPDGWDPGCLAMVMAPTLTGDGPSSTRGAAMWLQEDHRLVIAALGAGRDHPPRDPDGFAGFLHSCGAGEMAHLYRRFTRGEPIATWRNAASRRRDFASLERRPEGFVVLGDAVMAVNPLYGQGMATAAMGARLLGETLAERAGTHLLGLAADFQQRLNQLLLPAWQFATSSDFGVPGVEIDGRPQAPSVWAGRTLALAAEDPALSLKLIETLHLVRGMDWLNDDRLRTRVVADWERLGSLSRPGPPLHSRPPATRDSHQNVVFP
ncbi:NAD(P)/FAD-dependent oxidoreductase [Kineosporia succinea]|uniref:2-polyprenyl-6-methoxyphenol hydroxylase-like FAD-dependent oxidoreductase n=1 Tax=Kineosporia succinea TaxID=84632 RepID=A0ABT9PB33_9ACTN|nr:hypothetical protein [Kineosporia succinea]MDP9829899.1 2-polyprenyl-6-methoxyphenol hydroxylase-like FAD-dependent oxidoreductase [Kineosporia succinea]